MAKRKAYPEQTEHDEDEEAAVGIEASVRSWAEKLEIDPWLDRATEMLQARPGVTIVAAVGAGFVLGLTLFSKIGRIALIGALGVGTELLVQKARRSLLDQEATT